MTAKYKGEMEDGQTQSQGVAPTPSTPQKGNFPAPDEIVVGGEEQQAQEAKDDYKPVPHFVCKNCKEEYRMHTVRSGIPIFWLVLILLVSIFIIVFIVFFICFCDSYEVCPKCGHFSGNLGSKNKGVCVV